MGSTLRRVRPRGRPYPPPVAPGPALTHPPKMSRETVTAGIAGDVTKDVI